MGHSLFVHGHFCLCLCNYLIYWYIITSNLSGIGQLPVEPGNYRIILEMKGTVAYV